MSGGGNALCDGQYVSGELQGAHVERLAHQCRSIDHEQQPPDLFVAPWWRIDSVRRDRSQQADGRPFQAPEVETRFLRRRALEKKMLTVWKKRRVTDELAGRTGRGRDDDLRRSPAG